MKADAIIGLLFKDTDRAAAIVAAVMLEDSLGKKATKYLGRTRFAEEIARRTGARTRSRHLEQGSPIRFAAMAMAIEKLGGPSPISSAMFFAGDLMPE